MPTEIEFRAPWSAKLRSSSIIVAVVLIASVVSGIFSWAADAWRVSLILIALPVIIVTLAALFMVRGYVLTDNALLVRRLNWNTSLPLDNLVSIAGDNEAMQGSLRLFGNGALFSFTGEFWNRKLGRYRALATDPARAVVLKYSKRRIVITPHDPQKFIVQARTLLKNRAR